MKIYLFIIVTLAVACQQKSLENQVEIGQTRIGQIDFFDEQLTLTSDDPILKIYCRFDECGEWGGHEEYLTISKKDKISFKLEYKKYNVDCDSMLTKFDGMGYIMQPKQELIETREIEIHDNEKTALVNFEFDMVKSKFKEEFPGHSGLIISMTNSDSSFHIYTYGGDDNHNNRLLESLKLER